MDKQVFETQMDARAPSSEDSLSLRRIRFKCTCKVLALLRARGLGGGAKGVKSGGMPTVD